MTLRFLYILGCSGPRCGLTSKSLDTGGRRAPVNSGCTARRAAAAAAGAAPMRSGGQNRRMNGSFRGRKKLLLEHMTKPAWMMTECFGSRRQRERCARARKGVQGRVMRRAATHCAFSPNLFHGQITQKSTNQTSSPENKKIVP